jgi:type III secretion system low calcium response chaperone LcrH/SycD
MSDKEAKELWDKLNESIEKVAETLAYLATQQMAEKHPQASKQEQESIKKNFSHTLQPIAKRMESGMIKILDLLTGAGGHDLDLFSDEVSEQLCQIAAVASVLAEHPQEYLMLLANDKTLRDVFGITPETLETFYQASKHLYEQQHYSEAAAAFSVLSVINPDNHIFWLGLGNSEYFSHNYEAALVAYAMTAQANPNDPLCHFFSARCYEAMKQKDLAINALELAIIAIGDNTEHAVWKQRAEEHKQRLSRRS